MDIRGKYSTSLLSLATGRKIIAGTPLAFGEGDTKGRIKNVMNYKKPTLWIIIVAVIAVGIVGIALAANPIVVEKRNDEKYTLNGSYSLGGDSDDLTETRLSFDVSISGEKSDIENIDAYEVLVNTERLDLLLENGPFSSRLYDDYFQITGSLLFDTVGMTKEMIDDAALLEGIKIIDKAGNEFELYFNSNSDNGTAPTRSVNSNDNGTLPDLDTAISETILEWNRTDTQSGDFSAEAHTTLAIVEDGDVITVYLMALHLNFGYSGGGFSELGGSHMPIAITFERDTSGDYVMTEYWIPQDGAYYAPSIGEKFPANIYEVAIDTQRYIYAHVMSCYEQTIKYGDVETDYQIEMLIETICSSPAIASNPKEYIDLHSIEFRELVYYGRYTLDYCFNLFEQGGQTGLEGHIMAIACRDILTILGEPVANETVNTGQEWYDVQKEGNL